METRHIKMSGMLARLARIGGLSVWCGKRTSTCEVYTRAIIGVVFIILGTMLAVGTAFATIFLLASLGLPSRSEEFFNNSSILLKALILLGIMVYTILGVACVIFVVLGIIFGIVLLVEFSIKNYHLRLLSEIRDFLKGLCKPIQIVD